MLSSSRITQAIFQQQNSITRTISSPGTMRFIATYLTGVCRTPCHYVSENRCGSCLSYEQLDENPLPVMEYLSEWFSLQPSLSLSSNLSKPLASTYNSTQKRSEKSRLLRASVLQLHGRCRQLANNRSGPRSKARKAQALQPGEAAFELVIAEAC